MLGRELTDEKCMKLPFGTGYWWLMLLYLPCESKSWMGRWIATKTNNVYQIINVYYLK